MVLIAEKNENSSKYNYKKAGLNKLGRESTLPIIILFIFAISIIQVILNIKNKNYYNGTLLLVKLFGVLSTIALLWYEYDSRNILLQKVCSFSRKVNCSAILNSKASKVIGNITWSDIGFIYFTGGFLLLLFAPEINSLNILSVINLITLPYIFFSLYYQAKIAKQWCFFCLIVQALLMLEFGLTISLNKLSKIQLFYWNKNDYLIVFMSYFIPAAFWLFSKPYIYEAKEGKELRYKFYRLKNNEGIFDTLLRRQPSLKNFPEHLGIIIGNLRAKNTLITVCNPFCSACSTAQFDLISLLQYNSNWKVNIIFTASGEEDDPSTFPVAHFLAVSEMTKDNSILQFALKEWYSTRKKNYEAFSKKYPINADIKLQFEKVKDMKEWCKKEGIQFTPTFFVNGYSLPEQYDVNDLRYLEIV